MDTISRESTFTNYPKSKTDLSKLQDKIQTMRTSLCRIHEKDGSNFYDELLMRTSIQVEDLATQLYALEAKEQLSKASEELLPALKIYVTELERLVSYLTNDVEKKLRPIDCLDIMNIIGAIVVSGNVRRSAQIAIGDYDDIQFLEAKDWSNGNIPNWRAMSNNSVVCNDISKLPPQFWEGYEGNGEPYGLINLRNARAVGRTGDTSYPDPDVAGFNPCAEQSLAPYENVLFSRDIFTKHKKQKRINRSSNLLIQNK